MHVISLNVLVRFFKIYHTRNFKIFPYKRQNPFLMLDIIVLMIILVDRQSAAACLYNSQDRAIVFESI